MCHSSHTHWRNRQKLWKKAKTTQEEGQHLSATKYSHEKIRRIRQQKLPNQISHNRSRDKREPCHQLLVRHHNLGQRKSSQDEKSWRNLYLHTKRTQLHEQETGEPTTYQQSITVYWSCNPHHVATRFAIRYYLYCLVVYCKLI